MRIIGPPSASYAAALSRAGGGHQRFPQEMFRPLWDAAVRYGIDPVGVIAQAWKETGGGRYGGQVRPSSHNTCGVKLTAQQQREFPGVTDGDNPLAHAQFASWEVGAEAHVQHLAAYTGLVVQHMVVDPRYWIVAALTSGGRPLEQWSEFGGGRWAPSPTYGAELEAIMRRLQGVLAL